MLVNDFGRVLASILLRKLGFFNVGNVSIQWEYPYAPRQLSDCYCYNDVLYVYLSPPVRKGGYFNIRRDASGRALRSPPTHILSIADALLLLAKATSPEDLVSLWNDSQMTQDSNASQ